MQSKAEMDISLENARKLVNTYFEVVDCPWEKRFHIDQRQCRECTDGHVCEWLFQLDPAPDPSVSSTDQVREVLSFAVGYLEGQMLRADHETDHCPCAICVWVREAQALLPTE